MAHKIIFFGTPEFAEYHLKALVNDSRYQVVAVVSQPDRPAGRKLQLQPSSVKKFAQLRKLPVLTPDSAKDPDFIQKLEAFGAESAVVVAYGQILSEKLLSLFPNKVVNVHASLLPRWRGAAPIQRCLMAGDEVTGVSLQVMVKALDAGDVIAEKKFQVPEDMNAIQLHDQLKVLGAELLVSTLSRFLKGDLSPTPQDESLVTYAKKIEKSESPILWGDSAKSIYNQFRGLALGPGVKAQIHGKHFKLVNIRPSSHTEKMGAPGTIVGVDEKAVKVACGSGLIEVLEIQPESRAKMPISEFIKGYPIHKGDRFE